jgi:hypothetical protein
MVGKEDDREIVQVHEDSCNAIRQAIDGNEQDDPDTAKDENLPR